jgi:methylase of polypeptide subunit release factors
LKPLALLRRAWRGVARSKLLARLLLGLDPPPLLENERYFDLTTHALVRAVAPRVSCETRVLDMGTGAFATIGIALWRRTGCRVTSTDIHPEIVRRARESAARNGAPLRVLEARFFEGLDEAFDVVTFNIPYVPSHLVADPEVPQPYPFQSDGGPEGTSVIEAFLDDFAARGGSASAFLGVNRLLVGPERFEPLVAKRPSLLLAETIRPWLVPVTIFVVRRRAAPDAAAVRGAGIA